MGSLGAALAALDAAVSVLAAVDLDGEGDTTLVDGLTACQRLLDTLACGQVRMEHVMAVTEAMVPGRTDAVCEAEAILPDLARVAPPREVRRAIRHLADAVDADGSSTPAWDDIAPDPRRELRLPPAWTGCGG